MAEALAEAEARLAEARAQAEHAAAEAEQAAAERDEARARGHALGLRNEVLSSAIRERDRGASAPAGPKAPSTVDELLAFAQFEMGPHVVAMPRAIRETNRVRNDVDVGRLHEALVALRDVYVPMRLGRITIHDCKKHLTGLGLAESQVKADPNKNHYTVPYEGGTRTLDRHLKWGVGTSQSSMGRIYFFWDDEAQRVVIGHMPTHLPD